MDSKNYWDNKIIKWEDSTRGEQNVPLVEKIATFFRKPVKFRMNMCLAALAPYAKGKTVLDLGCGSGYFIFELYRRASPEHLIGIDISNNAIQRAQKIAAEKNLTAKTTFIAADVPTVAMPPTDITVGLGFFDYLTLAEIRTIFSNLKSKYFLFTFCEPKFSFLRYLHILYMWSQKCTKHYYYAKAEIRDCIGSQYGDVRFYNDKNLSFSCVVHNLPDFANASRQE